LRTADFFDVSKYPTMTFTNTSYKKVGPKKGILYGKLTFHGITKPIKLNVTFFGMVTNPMNKKTTAGFQVTGVVKRSDYALGSKYPNVVIGDEIHITANVEFSPNK
jgi:polyisoprenoid-binding protein YceI